MQNQQHTPTTKMEFQGASTVTLILGFIIFLYILQKLIRKAMDIDKMKPPQPAGSWPLIGHLHLLRGGPPHKLLGKLADEYGPIFMMKLGFRKALVVSTPELVMECLGNGDKVFLNRPHTMHVELLCYNMAMFGFAPYGTYWRHLRKVTTIELLSNHRIEMSKHVQISEVRSSMKAIFDNYQAKMSTNAGSIVETVDLKNLFSDITLNSIVRLIAGKSLKEFYQGEEYDRVKKVLREFFELGSVYAPSDALPFLRWLDIGGHEKAMKKTAKNIDLILQTWVDEHRRRKTIGYVKGNEDFIDTMLGIIENGLDIPSIFDEDTLIKSTCLGMILGGADTTSVTLGWAFSLILNNKKVLNKVRAELDTKVGKERLVNNSDLQNLPYLQAILKETMRLYPAAPLSAPREAATDCTVKGYHIPKGTMLILNVYKIHRDSQAWPNNLSEFHPERFLTTHKDCDVRGLNYELLPFGTGRRVCPGITFSLGTMQFTLASLLQGFEISTPYGEMVDMTECSGLTNLKASPLEVILTPRLSNHDLYNAI